MRARINFFVISKEPHLLCALSSIYIPANKTSNDLTCIDIYITQSKLRFPRAYNKAPFKTSNLPINDRREKIHHSLSLPSHTLSREIENNPTSASVIALSAVIIYTPRCIGGCARVEWTTLTERIIVTPYTLNS